MTMAIGAAARRLAKTSPGLVLMASKISGEDSLRPMDHYRTIQHMGILFARAGWKPRLRVKAGRREWSLPCPA